MRGSDIINDKLDIIMLKTYKYKHLSESDVSKSISQLKWNKFLSVVSYSPLFYLK